MGLYTHRLYTHKCYHRKRDLGANGGICVYERRSQHLSQRSDPRYM